ncbi:Cytochrome P [Trema orientale]|uniref:Cytochrome P n=1 Tax=Trema orientale TaxID=63057 RepID=A0A2P5FN22_TREOI|nr:Cytochrome P [Trema orientale]
MAIFHETLTIEKALSNSGHSFALCTCRLTNRRLLYSRWNIAINIYGCNMDEKQWESPEEWKAERFLDKEYDLID